MKERCQFTAFFAKISLVTHLKEYFWQGMFKSYSKLRWGKTSGCRDVDLMRHCINNGLHLVLVGSMSHV